MELSFDFDDDDFTEKTRKKRILNSYNAKICQPEWFMHDSKDVDESERATLFKFRGDYHYCRKDIKAAINCYKICLDNLGASNRTMRREMIESLARCYMAVGEFYSAQIYIGQINEDSTTIENFCQSLVLQHRLYHRSGNLKDEVRVLHQLISLHPVNAQFWLQLTEAYEKVRDIIICTSVQHCQDKACDTNTYDDTQHAKCHCKHDSSSGIEGKFQSLQLQTELCSQRTAVKSPSSDKYPAMCGANSVHSSTCDETAVLATDLLYAQEHLDRAVENDKGGCNSALVVCNSEDLKEILTGYPISLVLLTCYVRTRLIFLSVQGTGGSFIKDRNVQVVHEMDRKIKAMSVEDKIQEDVTQFVRKDLFEESSVEDCELEQNPDTKIYKETRAESREFNDRWFSWIKKPPVSITD